MISVKDQLGKWIELERAPQRIVSLVPSQTELLYDLGLGERVVGITRFCIHPKAWFDNKKRIGGTKDVHIDRVKALNPDLIIGNKEENTKSDIEALQSVAPVWMSDIYTLEDAIDMINGVGEVCGRSSKSAEIAAEIKRGFSNLSPRGARKKALYFIWKDPFMVAGSDTFIDHVLCKQLGFYNVLAAQKRYPVIDLNDIEDPDFIFLSTEPFPFNDSHKLAFETKFPNAKVELVDGEYFTWYGSRLMGAPGYFRELLNKLELH